MSFRLARPEQVVAQAFYEEFLAGRNKKAAITSPIPFGAGQLKFTIERNRKGFNKLYPEYTMYFERPYGNRIVVLYGCKKAFNKTANYLISLAKNSGRNSKECIGKLRAF